MLSESIEENWSENQRWSSNFEYTRARVDQQIQQIQADLSGRDDRIRRIMMSSYEQSGNTSTAATGNEATALPTSTRRRGEEQRVTRDPRRAISNDESSAAAASPTSTRRRGEDPRMARRPAPTGTGTFTSIGTGNLLDDGNPPTEPPSLRPDSVEASSRPPTANRWGAKRRKLDSDDSREGPRGFSYGQHGQVVPGALKMELVSCDGGTYEAEGECSWPENVLHNDSSVYCTKSDRCNLILRHCGETPFCLKKLVIKAPKSGFDAP